MYVWEPQKLKDGTRLQITYWYNLKVDMNNYHNCDVTCAEIEKEK